MLARIVYRTIITVSLCVASILSFSFSASADYIVDYYEVRQDPVLKLISIRSESFRSESAHKNAKKNRKELERQGIFLADVDKETKHTCKYDFGRQKVVVELVIHPPEQSGYGGVINYTHYA